MVFFLGETCVLILYLLKSYRLSKLLAKFEIIFYLLFYSIMAYTYLQIKDVGLDFPHLLGIALLILFPYIMALLWAVIHEVIAIKENEK